MKKFETFAIKQSEHQEVNLLVIHPFASDIYDIIEEFNTSNTGVNNVREIRLHSCCKL